MDRTSEEGRDKTEEDSERQKEGACRQACRNSSQLQRHFEIWTDLMTLASHLCHDGVIS